MVKPDEADEPADEGDGNQPRSPCVEDIITVFAVPPRCIRPCHRTAAHSSFGATRPGRSRYARLCLHAFMLVDGVRGRNGEQCSDGQAVLPEAAPGGSCVTHQPTCLRAGGEEQTEPAVRAAGLSHRLTPYSMRHTFISWAIVTPGMSMFEIAKMAGTSAAQIEKTYAHLLRGHADRWRTALDAYDQGFGHLVDTGGK